MYVGRTTTFLAQLDFTRLSRSWESLRAGDTDRGATGKQLVRDLCRRLDWEYRYSRGTYIYILALMPVLLHSVMDKQLNIALFLPRYLSLTPAFRIADSKPEFRSDQHRRLAFAQQTLAMYVPIIALGRQKWYTMFPQLFHCGTRAPRAVAFMRGLQ